MSQNSTNITVEHARNDFDSLIPPVCICKRYKTLRVHKNLNKAVENCLCTSGPPVRPLVNSTSSAFSSKSCRPETDYTSPGSQHVDISLHYHDGGAAKAWVTRPTAIHLPFSQISNHNNLCQMPPLERHARVTMHWLVCSMLSRLLSAIAPRWKHAQLTTPKHLHTILPVCIYTLPSSSCVLRPFSRTMRTAACEMYFHRSSCTDHDCLPTNAPGLSTELTKCTLSARRAPQL